MPISINNTTLTFNDATTQTTAGLVSGGALGTPSSGALTNCTSVPVNQATGTLPVSNGGTGATSLTANNVLLGNGTSALQVVAPGSNGNILTSNGSTWTSAAPAGGGVTSAVAGNGIAVSGATGAVTFSAACPSFNTVGSYCLGVVQPGNGSVAAGGTLSAGGGTNQITALNMSDYSGTFSGASSNILSGTWRNMGPGVNIGGSTFAFLACRVS